MPVLFRRGFVLWLFPSLLFAQSASDPSACCAPTPASLAWTRFAAQAQAALRANRSVIPPLAPAPEGVVELSFKDFFGPIGDRGLEYSEKMRALAGHRVRIAGFMVHQQVGAAGILLLTATPVLTHEQEYGLCDDLPPALLHVHLPSGTQRVPLAPGPLVLTGQLEIGPQVELDGRNSVARLILETSDGAPLLPSAFSVAAATMASIPSR